MGIPSRVSLMCQTPMYAFLFLVSTGSSLSSPWTVILLSLDNISHRSGDSSPTLLVLPLQRHQGRCHLQIQVSTEPFYLHSPHSMFTSFITLTTFCCPDLLTYLAPHWPAIFLRINALIIDVTQVHRWYLLFLLLFK